jgi:hypothetical protein
MLEASRRCHIMDLYSDSMEDYTNVKPDARDAEEELCDQNRETEH